jgi:acetylglutamate kinase
VTGAGSRSRAVVVLKLGGELLEQPEDLARVATGIVALASQVRLVVVHGGGREIDAALATAGIPKRQVDGLRVTDQATLHVVVAVLAGTLNTRLVSAVRRAGGQPVGLTGADAEVAVVRRVAPIQTVAGDTVDLGLVGEPVAGARPDLLRGLLKSAYIPIVACIGATKNGDLLNVNADTLASHLAAALGARRLIIAGGTAGVLDETGQTIPRLTSRGAGHLVRRGVANKGMVAKLEACRTALRRGVGDVIITNGRVSPFKAMAARTFSAEASTRVVR